MCTSCGLCCMGALHDRAKLEPDEVRWAREIGLPVIKGSESFSLPCPKLIERKCSIFEHRPAVCPRYRCQLLLDAEGGRISLDAALTIVQQAHALLHAALDSVIVDTLAEARHRARFKSLDEVLADTEASRSEVLAERLHVTALDVYLDRHFRNSKEDRMFVGLKSGNSGEVQVKKAGERNSKP